MKRTIIILLGCAALMLPASGFEKRTFKSADNSKSFEGALTGFDAAKGLVTVRMTGGRDVSFKLSILSTEDQEYIKENANVLAAANAIRLDFEIYKDKNEAVKVEVAGSKTTTTPAGYEIELRNSSKKDVENVEINYTIFHRKDAENGRGSVAQTSGSLEISTIFSNSDDTNRTLPVNLIRYARQKSGGGG